MNEPDIYDLVAQAERNGTEPDGQDSTDTNGTGRTEPNSPSQPGQDTPESLDQIDPPILAGRQYTLAQVKTAAYNGEFPAPTVPMPDRVLWITLRDAYAQYRSGKVSKEQGEARINEAIKQYRQDMTQYNDMIGVVHHIATYWKQIEAAASEYAKSPDRTAEADKFYNAVYGAIPK